MGPYAHVEMSLYVPSSNNRSNDNEFLLPMTMHDIVFISHIPTPIPSFSVLHAAFHQALSTSFSILNTACKLGMGLGMLCTTLKHAVCNI